MNRTLPVDLAGGCPLGDLKPQVGGLKVAPDVELESAVTTEGRDSDNHSAQPEALAWQDVVLP